MPALPILSGDQLVKALEKAGFLVVRKRGCHITLHKGTYATVVPLHFELARGTLLGILKQCGLSQDELKALVEGSND